MATMLQSASYSPENYMCVFFFPLCGKAEQDTSYEDSANIYHPIGEPDEELLTQEKGGRSEEGRSPIFL
jgi:hypothetical protein